MLSQSWGERWKLIPRPFKLLDWLLLHLTNGSSGQNSRSHSGMSQSASSASELPKGHGQDRGILTSSPPPQSRHLLQMDTSSSDLEKVNQSSTESLRQSFKRAHISFRTASRDSLPLDSRTCSTGDPYMNPPTHPPSAGKTLCSCPSPIGLYKGCFPQWSCAASSSAPERYSGHAASSPDGFF